MREKLLKFPSVCAKNMKTQRVSNITKRYIRWLVYKVIQMGDLRLNFFFCGKKKI